MDALGPSASRCAGSRSSGTMVANIIVDPLSPQKKPRSIGRTRVGHTHGSTIVDHTSIYNFQISALPLYSLLSLFYLVLL